MSASVGRLIPLHLDSGSMNMAADQALLESVERSGSPVLRFYGWRNPTLSLGYFQRDADRTTHAESRQLDCVRRATGGGAIVHHHELTYSIAVPAPVGSVAIGPRRDLYQMVHRGLSEALLDFGIRATPARALAQTPPLGLSKSFLCFQRRTDEDLVISGYKVVGSAQRKLRGAVLQHGSVLLRASQWAPQLPGVEDLTSQRVSSESLAESLACRLANSFGLDWLPGSFTDAECQRTSQLVREQFASPAWKRRR